jgi:succinoglycan biosynthesis protein ExoM
VVVVICICTYKRSELLQRLLLSLRHMQLGELDPKDFRALVVDNYPDGRAREVFNSVSGTFPIELDFIEETQQGRPFARNRAVHEALRRDGDFIAFIDDDDLPEPDWLLRLIAKQRETRADIVFGTERQVFNADWPAWLRESPLFQKAYKQGVTEYGTPGGLSTYNVLINRSIIEKVRSTTGIIFSPEFARFTGEDTEFFIRAARSGATFVRADESVINRNYEPHRVTVLGLLREAKRLGTYNMVLLKRYGASGQASRRRTKAVAKIASNLLKLPFCMFSRVALMRDLFYLARELATLRAYYGRTSLKRQSVTQ